MKYLFYRGKRQFRIFSVACSVEGGDQVAGFIGDPHFTIGEPLVAECFTSFGIKKPFAFGFEEVDAGCNGKCQACMAVSRCCKGQIS